MRLSDWVVIKVRAKRDAAKAAVEAAKTTLEQANLDLGYTRVTAPISGRISRNQVDVGNLVDGQATLLAMIVKDDPIYAYMNVSAADMLWYRKRGSDGERVDYRTKKIRLDLGLADEEGFPHEGYLDYVDPDINPNTGTITMRGVFPNPNRAILPGLFVRIRVTSDEPRRDALLVDERALGADQAGSYVLVVNEKKGNEVERRPVKVGAKDGDKRVIEGDVGPNDLVIVNGLQRPAGREGQSEASGIDLGGRRLRSIGGVQEVPAPSPKSTPAEVVKSKGEALRPRDRSPSPRPPARRGRRRHALAHRCAAT